MRTKFIRACLNNAFRLYTNKFMKLSYIPKYFLHHSLLVKPCQFVYFELTCELCSLTWGHCPKTLASNLTSQSNLCVVMRVTLYVKYLMALHNHINQHFQISLHLQPLGISVDFEIALFEEAQLAFPCSEVLGCLFHFSKNIKKKTNSLSTASALYRSDPESALSCRMVIW